MKIADFKEYMAAVRSLYSGSSVEEQEAFLFELKSASVQREKAKKKLQAELKKIRCQTNQLRHKIKQTQHLEDKIAASREIKEYQQLKKELIRKNAELGGITRFEMLEHSAKTAACTDFLLKKYLTNEILQNNPLGFRLNEQGDIVVDVEQLQNSHLYQEAAHIRDYVSSYICMYPYRVSGAGYFNGKLAKVKSWAELLEIADLHFAEINRLEKENKDKEKKISESREGIECIEIYANDNLQAVRLLSENALKYEGREMGHCVGSYYEKIKNGTSQIYSIRDYNENGEQLPHATIEVLKGNIVQIKGRHNKMVAPRYIKAARRLAIRLSGLETSEQLKNAQKIPNTELDNLGFMQDKNGIRQDIFSANTEEIELWKLIINGEDLNYLDLEKLKITELCLGGVLNQAVLNNLSRLKSVKAISFSNVKSVEGAVLDFRELSEIKALKLDTLDVSAVKKMYLPDNLQELSLGEINHKIDIVHSPKLEELNMTSSSVEVIKYFTEKTSTPILNMTLKDMNVREDLYCTQTNSLAFENCCLEEDCHIIVSENLQRLKVEKSSGLFNAIVFETQNNIKKLESDDKDVFNSNVINPKLTFLSFFSNVELKEKEARQISEMSGLQTLNLKNVSYHAEQPWSLPKNIGMIFLGNVVFDGVLNLEKCSKLKNFMLNECESQNADIRLNTVLRQTCLNVIRNKICTEFKFDGFEGIKKLMIGNLDLSTRNKELKFPQTVRYLSFGGWLPDRMTEFDLTPYKNLQEIDMGMMSGRNVERIIFPENLVEFTFGEIGQLKSLKELDLSRCHKMTDWNETLLQQFSLIKFPKTIKNIPWKKMWFNDKVRIELHPDTPPEVVEDFKAHLGDKVVIGKKQPQKENMNLLPILYDKCQGF